MSCYCYFSFSPTAEPQLLTSGTWRCLPNGLPIWSALGSCLGSRECLGWTPISECLLGCAFWCGTLQGGLAPFSYQVTLLRREEHLRLHISYDYLSHTHFANIPWIPTVCWHCWLCGSAKTKNKGYGEKECRVRNGDQYVYINYHHHYYYLLLLRER